MKNATHGLHSRWPLLLGALALLALRGNAAEPTLPPPAPVEKPAPAPPADAAPVEEKGPTDLPPGERGSADNNITFPVDI
jgi:hypothetical protein